MKNTWRAVGAGAICLALTVTGCSSSNSGDNNDNKSGGSSSGAAKLEGRGPIKFAQGKDNTGQLNRTIDAWNAKHPDEKVTFVSLPESADEQRAQFVNNAQAKSSELDVLGLDVVWTAEFAANRWVDELPAGSVENRGLLPSTVETGKYFNKVYGVPFYTNGMLLYFRKDLLDAAGVTKVPTTFDEMWQACDKIKALPEGAGMSCYAGQFAKYEGMTVNVSQAINGAGGSLFDAQNKPQASSDAAKKGLTTLKDGFDKGYIAKEALTYKEEESRQAFMNGKAVFLTNWPYVYPMASKTDGSSQIEGKFGVAPIPGVTGPGKTTLGGENLAISSFSKNKATALDFITYLTGEAQKEYAMTTGLPPVVESLYSDPDMTAKYSYYPDLKKALDSAQGRPQVVKYGDVTVAIQENSYAALSGEKSVDQVLGDMQNKLQTLTQK